jgi:integrase
VFGGYPLNSITRTQIDEWVHTLMAAGKQPSTVRHAYFVVRQVLRQAAHDNRIPANPADNVRLPRERSANGGKPGVVDDPAQFLPAEQVAALVDSTPWQYNLLVHIAAWAGLRAGELGGLQIGDVHLGNASGTLHVHQTIIRSASGTVVYDSTKTDASRRRVPLMPQTVDLLHDYLAEHPRRDDPTAPLFPAFRLSRHRPTGVRAANTAPPPTRQAAYKAAADRQLAALAALSVPEHAGRLVLDWAEPLRHMAFYKVVFRPAVVRAGLSPDLRFHSLRHTYVSACVAAGIEPLKISRYVGHSKVTTTLDIYTHLFGDDHADEMSALGSLATPTAPNVVRLRG